MLCARAIHSYKNGAFLISSRFAFDKNKKKSLGETSFLVCLLMLSLLFWLLRVIHQRLFFLFFAFRFSWIGFNFNCILYAMLMLSFSQLFICLFWCSVCAFQNGFYVRHEMLFCECVHSLFWLFYLHERTFDQIYGSIFHSNWQKHIAVHFYISEIVS